MTIPSALGQKDTTVLRSAIRHGLRMAGAHRYAIGMMLAVLTGANLSSTALAQSVDIERELTEAPQPKVPFLKSRPWLQFRSAWLEHMQSLERDFGLRAGVDFTSVFQHAAGLDSPNNTAVGNLDVYALWKLVDLGALGQGSAAALLRTRGNFAELNGNELSQRIGLPWSINNSGSAGYTRFNQFWWEQVLLHQTLAFKFGRLDQSALFDQNRVAGSDGKQFMMQPLVQNQTIAFPSNGAGVNLHYKPSPRLYVTAGLGDANGSPDVKPAAGLDSFAQGKYFEAMEIGISPELSSLWANAQEGTYRFIAWHTATTDSHPAGYGVALSLDQEVSDAIVSFLRFGICPDDVFRSSVELSGGVVTPEPFGRATDRAGIGASWSQPVAHPHRDQFAMELFYRLEVVEGVAVTPDVELIAAPAAQPGRDFVAVLGLRLRLSL